MKSDMIMRILCTIAEMRKELRELIAKRENFRERITLLQNNQKFFFFRKTRIKISSSLLRKLRKREEGMIGLIRMQEVSLLVLRGKNVSVATILLCGMEILFALVYVELCASEYSIRQNRLIEKMRRDMLFVIDEYKKAV